MVAVEGDAASQPVESRAQLAAYLESGGKPQEAWRIGTEHEKFGFHTADLSPVPYDGPSGIAALLHEMGKRFGWEPVYEGENIVALKDPSCDLGGSITLEPGGQFELSGAPVRDLHETCAEVNTHLYQVRDAGSALGIGMLGLGFSPKWTRAEVPRMPKGRYGIMSAYMPKVGKLGLDMMYRSCTVQVNLDFADEADMVKKLRVSLALQPVATALFANSPFTEGRPNGFLSFRSQVWLDTDKARTGMLPFAFEDGMGFERYVDYALDVPMYFVYRDGRYIDASGASFRDFLAGKLAQLPGERPIMSDWTDHLTTLFPEVRLKKFLEMRGADGGPWRRLCALSALWTGLLYDRASLDAAWALVKDWTAEERQAMRDAVPRRALYTPFRDGTILPIARDMVEIAKQGLARRNRLNGSGDDETIFLESLEEIVASKMTPAELLLQKFEHEWKGDIDRIFTAEAY
ncbi:MULTISPECIES: glutamate--cysteine ligase [Rhodomicrobium]|uniref:glutamate--cysteine ligase n=1 Tax=Rhodomicrobium TaxID=1068 RepID=UPI000B4ACDDD|nr:MULTISPECIES: glutamate--cysteine ligase [Rhodomicrobium]